MHGCSACHDVFQEMTWPRRLLREHYAKGHDLVCPQCTTRGYEPFKYSSYKCSCCCEEFGCNNFSKYMVNKVKKKLKVRLVCRSCQANSLRCSKCHVAYDSSHWTAHERSANKTGSTNIVCKGCRAQGFRPHNVEAYSCQVCKGNFGSLKFDTVQLMHFRTRGTTPLVCKDCSTNAVRCSKCAVAYPKAHWTSAERLAARKNKIVCNLCREQGFGPKSLKPLTCQSCKGNFGYLKFSKHMRIRSSTRPHSKQVCLKCMGEVQGEDEASADANNPHIDHEIPASSSPADASHPRDNWM